MIVSWNHPDNNNKMDTDFEQVENHERAQIEEPLETEDAFNQVAAEVNSVQHSF